MLLLTLTCLRAEQSPADFIEAAKRGDLQEAVRSAFIKHPRSARLCAKDKAAHGQVLGRVFIAMGREEQADEVFQKQLRLYETISRPMVRWMSCLDRGVMFLHRNKMIRAAEAFSVAADDFTAPAELRIEALAGLARAFHGVGEHLRAIRTLYQAMDLAKESQADQVLQMLQAMRCEMRVLEQTHCMDGYRMGADSSTMEDHLPQEQVLKRVEEFVDSLSHVPLAAARMRFMAELMKRSMGLTEHAGPLLDELRWINERQIAGVEEQSKIEALLVFLAQEDVRHAVELLGVLATDEVQTHRSRYALELKFCLSRLYALQGRHIDALRMYREHTIQAMTRLRHDLSKLPYSHSLEKESVTDGMDATQLQLPLRYRKAYLFILENLEDRDLSIKRVAAHIDVTERALQMAFRTYLGQTPAELIRRRRLEHIRTELRESNRHVGVLEVATRWGMSIRSTLAQNYRHQFDETPTKVRSSMVLAEELK